jgi:hypothetical protein
VCTDFFFLVNFGGLIPIPLKMMEPRQRTRMKTLSGQFSQRSQGNIVKQSVMGVCSSAIIYDGCGTESAGGTDTPTVDGEENPGRSAVILRNQDNTVSRLSDSAAGEATDSEATLLFTAGNLHQSIGQFLQERSYQGLEARVGQDAPSLLEQGRSGIARGYKDDHQ